jgi:hypothetical protein
MGACKCDLVFPNVSKSGTYLRGILYPHAIMNFAGNIPLLYLATACKNYISVDTSSTFLAQYFGLSEMVVLLGLRIQGS